MNIKVIGTGCDKCDKLFANTKQAVEELQIEAGIEKVEDLMEIVKLGVMVSPTLMVDGKVVLGGKVVSVDKIKKLLSK